MRMSLFLPCVCCLCYLIFSNQIQKEVICICHVFHKPSSYGLNKWFRIVCDVDVMLLAQQDTKNENGFVCRYYIYRKGFTHKYQWNGIRKNGVKKS